MPTTLSPALADCPYYPVTATFYDLIPLLNPDEYLRGNSAFARHYDGKLKSLTRADGLLAISHFARSEAAQLSQYPTEKIAVAPLGPLSSDENQCNANNAAPNLALQHWI